MRPIGLEAGAWIRISLVAVKTIAIECSRGELWNRAGKIPISFRSEGEDPFAAIGQHNLDSCSLGSPDAEVDAVALHIGSTAKLPRGHLRFTAVQRGRSA
jgi:hypothetical protein